MQSVWPMTDLKFCCVTRTAGQPTLTNFKIIKETLIYFDVGLSMCPLKELRSIKTFSQTCNKDSSNREICSLWHVFVCLWFVCSRYQ